MDSTFVVSDTLEIISLDNFGSFLCMYEDFRNELMLNELLSIDV